jgi:hypothetical protein
MPMSLSFLLFSYFIAVGLETAIRRIPHLKWKRVSIIALCVSIPILPVLTYAAFPVVLDTLSVKPVKIRSLPYRDNMRYFLMPWKHQDRGPERFAIESFEQAENATIIVDFTPLTVLKYYKNFEGYGQNTKLQSSESIDLSIYLRENIAKKKLFIVEPDLVRRAKGCENLYEFGRAGTLFRITLKQ